MPPVSSYTPSTSVLTDTDRRFFVASSKKYVQQQCERCGKTYTVRANTASVQRYCSKRCGKPLRIEQKCAACGKIMLLPPSRKASHFFCSKECMSMQCIPKECIECGKPFLDTGKNIGKFCSNDCRLARNRREQVHKKCPTTEHTCEHCGKKYQSRYKRQRFCCQGCKATHQGSGKDNGMWKDEVSFTCKRCGKEKWVKPGRVLTYCSKDCWDKDRAERRYDDQRTTIEVAIAELLSSMNVAFWEQYPVDWYTCDMFLPKYNLIIECDGDYWHNLPKSKTRDKRKDGHLAKLNYKVLRLPESKIRTNLEWCRKQIAKAIR